MHEWYHVLWTGPAVVLAAIVIGWGAETAQMYISQGIALAILAWLQTLPEFAVEAVVAWHQRQDLMIANLSGSLRLLVGLGWPLIYFTYALIGRGRKKGSSWPVVKLAEHNGLEVLALLLGTTYFAIIWYKKTLTIIDGLILFVIYFYYLWKLSHQPSGSHEELEDLPAIGKKIVRLNPKARWASIIGLFLIGGVILEFSAHPFLNSLEAVAVMFGVSNFVFIQWCAPFVSEFPEKVTAFQWARQGGKKVPMAFLNMVSSNIVQWTLMAGLLPMIFSVSKGAMTPIAFDAHQLTEILLTVLQSYLSILFLMDLEVHIKDAAGLLILWAAQFFVPHIREEIMVVYGIWIIAEVFILVRQKKLTYALRKFQGHARAG
jgi:cation:H+ antiporter